MPARAMLRMGCLQEDGTVECYDANWESDKLWD